MNRIKYIVLSLLLVTGSSVFADEFVKDEIMDELLQNVKVEKPYVNNKYNYESAEMVPVKLGITEKITTKRDELYDNQPVVLLLKKPVKYNNKVILDRGERFTANVATYNSRGMNGIPAAIILENFKCEKIDNKKLSGVYVKRGANLTPMVLPIKWALTPIPGVGSLTNFIFGGNATIKPKNTITIYYHPEW